jgi:membrane associated rhomboid family serine protease
VCDHCGARVSGHTRQVAGRRLESLLPGVAPVTSLLLLANVGGMLLLMLAHGAEQFFNPDAKSLTLMGALSPALFNQFAISEYNLIYRGWMQFADGFDVGGEWWRLITYGYLHGGVWHIAFNLYALSVIGPMLEEEVGRARMFTVYTLSVVVAGLAQLMHSPAYSPIPVVGASGGLFGLLVFGVVYMHFYGTTMHDQRNGLLKWVLFAFIAGFAVGAANMAHLGGAIVGAIFGFVVEKERKVGKRFQSAWNSMTVLCLVATLASMVLSLLWRSAFFKMLAVLASQG